MTAMNPPLSPTLVSRFRLNWRNGPRLNSALEQSWLQVDLRLQSHHASPPLGWTSTPLMLDLYSLSKTLLAQDEVDQFETECSYHLTFHPCSTHSYPEMSQRVWHDWQQYSRETGSNHALILPLVPDQNWTSEGPRPMLIQWEQPGQWVGRVQITGSPRTCVRNWRHILTAKRPSRGVAPPTPAISPPRDDDDQRQVRSIIDPPERLEVPNMPVEDRVVQMIQRVFKMFHHLVQQPPYPSHTLIGFLVNRRTSWTILLHKWANRRLRPPSGDVESVLKLLNEIDRALTRIAQSRDTSWMNDSDFVTSTYKTVKQFELVCLSLLRWTYPVCNGPSVESVPLSGMGNQAIPLTTVDLQCSLTIAQTCSPSLQVNTANTQGVQTISSVQTPISATVAVESSSILKSILNNTPSSSTSSVSLPCQETVTSSNVVSPTLTCSDSTVTANQLESSSPNLAEPIATPSSKPLSRSELIAKVKAVSMAVILNVLSKPTRTPLPDSPPSRSQVDCPGSPVEIQVWRNNTDQSNPNTASSSSCYLDTSSLKSLMLGLLEGTSSCQDDFSTLIDLYVSSKIVTHVFIQRFIHLLKNNSPDVNILDVESRLLSCSDLHSLVSNIQKSANPSLDIPVIALDSAEQTDSSDEIEIVEERLSSTNKDNQMGVRFLSSERADFPKTEGEAVSESNPKTKASHKISGIYRFQKEQGITSWILIDQMTNPTCQSILITTKSPPEVSLGDSLDVTVDEAKGFTFIKYISTKQSSPYSPEVIVECPLVKNLVDFRSCISKSAAIFLEAKTLGSLWTKHELTNPFAAGMTTKEWKQIRLQCPFTFLIRDHFWGVFTSTQKLKKIWNLKFQGETNYIALKTDLMALFVPSRPVDKIQSVQSLRSLSNLAPGELMKTFILPKNRIRLQAGDFTFVFAYHEANIKEAMNDLQHHRMVALSLSHVQNSAPNDLMANFSLNAPLISKTAYVLKSVQGLSEAWIGGNPREDPKEYLIVHLLNHSVNHLDLDGPDNQPCLKPDDKNAIGAKFDAIFFPKMMASQEHYQKVCQNIWNAKYVKLVSIDESCWVLNIGESSLFSRPLRIRSFDIENNRARTVILSGFRDEILLGNQPLLSTRLCLETACAKKRLKMKAWRWIISKSPDLDFDDMGNMETFTPNKSLQLSTAHSLQSPTSFLPSNQPVEPQPPPQPSSSENPQASITSTTDVSFVSSSSTNGKFKTTDTSLDLSANICFLSP